MKDDKMNQVLITIIASGIIGLFVGVYLGMISPHFLKKKHDFSYLKHMTRESGIKMLEAYKNIKKLDKIFGELENA